MHADILSVALILGLPLLGFLANGALALWRPQAKLATSLIGSGVLLGAFAAAVVLFQRLTGRILESNGNNYTPVFMMCGLAYVSALLVIHLLVPRMDRATLQNA